jgi:hypothetical protein
MRLRHPVVDGNRGSYYLGCTAPDIRYFIDASREETHFLSLDCEEGESGAKIMFEAYPELIDGANLTDATKSFVAGYLSHLVTDEAWIYRIYRPFFGASSLLGGEPVANLLDRLLQFELDRRERLRSSSMAAILADLSDSTSGVAVSFIDPAGLERWRQFLMLATTRKVGREQFRYFAENYLAWVTRMAPEERESFFASLDDRLAQALRTVPEERLQKFREESVEDSIRVAGEYLG